MYSFNSTFSSGRTTKHYYIYPAHGRNMKKKQISTRRQNIVFPTPPMSALRKPKKLRRIVRSSKLPPVKRSDKLKRRTHRDAPGWKKCGKSCHICPFTLPDCSEVTSQVNGQTHVITEAVNCDSTNCIYYWKCTKPNCQYLPNCEYIGMASRKFKDRMGEHRDYSKRDILTEPSGEHFNKRGHTVSDMKGQVIEKVKNKNPFVLRTRESMLIKKFDTFRHGLNKES